MRYEHLIVTLGEAVDWFGKLLYLSALWIGFSVLGGLVFGVMPSTVAMFAVIRKWNMGETDSPVFRVFWRTFRVEFWKANLLGLVLCGVALVLFVDARYVLFVHSRVTGLIGLLGLIPALLYAITLLYIFPVFAHVEASVWRILQLSLISSLAHPLRTLVLLFAFMIVLSNIHGLLLPLFIAFFAYGDSWWVMKIMRKLDVQVVASTKNKNGHVISY